MIRWLYQTWLGFMAALIVWFIVKPLYWGTRIFKGREYADNKLKGFLAFCDRQSARLREKQDKIT